MDSQIGIVIPTFQAAKHLSSSLQPLLKSSLKPRILVIDSSSTDGTIGIARTMGAETLVIPQGEFNHGTTREMGRNFLRTPFVVMMTQDAYAESPEMLERLIQPLTTGQASLSYARQLPHHGEGFFGAFSRDFNYPSTSHIRSLEDINAYGPYTFFISNSCAAYSSSALDEIGGFSPVLFGEDTVAAAKLLQRGHRIAYVADAEVRHSHDYTLQQEFCRHFDMGIARRTHQDLLKVGGSDKQRGKAYVKSLFRELWKTSPQLIPYAFFQTLVKWGGYRLGRASYEAPSRWNKIFSSQKSYWK